VERLAQHLFDGVDDPHLADEIAGWLVASPRFRAFAEAHRNKIHKKLRTAGDPEARRDVRAELLLAWRLLADRRIELAFEPRGSTVGGPDFAVTHRDHHALDLEVTRARRSLSDDVIAATVLVKLRQLPPSVANVLVVAGDGDQPVDIGGAVRRLRGRADAKDEVFFVERGFDGTRQFYDRFLRLGAVAVWREPASAGRVTSWRNASARVPVPERAFAAILARLETAS
jgi:hypothetical protein